jgi:hypothetical protein
MAKQMVSKQIQQRPPYGNGHWGLGVGVSGDEDSLEFSHGGRDEGFVATMFMLDRGGDAAGAVRSLVTGTGPNRRVLMRQ